MSPVPGDDSQSPVTRNAARFAGVFRGLTGTKAATSPVSQQLPSSTAANPPNFPKEIDAVSATLRRLPSGYMDSFQQLKSGSLNERIAAAERLSFAIDDYPLAPVLQIWDAGKDLIETSKPLAAREAGWGLLTKCVKYPYSTDLERREFFQTLSAPAHPDDFHLQLAALVDLTNHGRELSGFEYDIFPLLTRWLQDAYNAATIARKQASRGGGKSKGKMAVSGEESNFAQLFSFVNDVIKFNFKVADDTTVSILMGSLLEICMNTIFVEDLRACISVIDTIVTYGTIPGTQLKNCIRVLSSIHCLVSNLQKDAWHTLSNICKSHHGQSTVRILLDVLRTAPTSNGKGKDTVREVKGALSVLNALLSTAETGYPAVPLPLLVDGLVHISQSGSSKIAVDVLKLINSLLDGSDGSVAPVAAEEAWSPFFQVAGRCAELVSDWASGDTESSVKSAEADKGEADKEKKSEDTVGFQLRRLISRVEQLLRQRGSELAQRDECIAFLIRVQHALPDSAADLIIDHFKACRFCFPSEMAWKSNLKLVIEGFYRNRNRRPATRLQALATVQEVYEFLDVMDSFAEKDMIPHIVQQVLFGIEEESDTLVLQETVAFGVTVAERSELALFDAIVDSFRGVIAAERSRAPVLLSPARSHTMSDPQHQAGYFANQSFSNIVTRGYTQIFMRSMNTDPAKAKKAFNALVHIARSSACETDARLTALKLLVRLRADWAYHVYLAADPQSEALADSLYRTETSLARKLAEDAAHPTRLSRADASGTRTTRGISFSQEATVEKSGLSRSTSSARAVAQPTQRLWSLPDLDALPEPPSDRPSPVLLSHSGSKSGAEHSPGERATLNMASFVEAVVNTLCQVCDWEVYSFILVHLPAQLSNHPIFRDAIAEIQELRKVVCDLISKNNFQEPPGTSGLRRPDVANCLFHSLTMIMSFHQHFQKVDEDEIVRAFMLGIADKTAKTCIHALSVCCHELPKSVNKSLVTILRKMSQVITQPFVAMHILEFLACLSRLPALYSNFREDEYRVVFGICFRYLQYVRDRKRSVRNGSYSSEPATPNVATNSHTLEPVSQPNTDDLPQYVYALAYHVITFWFLALRVNDRPNHIGWIAKNLFTDVDGSASNDEQAQITIDFMQRVAFSDANDTVEDSLFKEEFFGEILQRRWIIGNSIVTVRQAKETGWAEVIRRFPSGMSCFQIRENFGPIPSHQEAASLDGRRDERQGSSSSTTLPSFVLLQLLAPIPQAPDPTLRPIPLPVDDAVDRAIRLFDSNAAVDGHKVGVIYIAEGQTKEADILANTIGNPDYVEFLHGLGTMVRLKGATFNTQGLDREFDTDGKYAFCWRDRVTEIVFHVTTQMPTDLERDPQCVQKKRHIGNDFVNIIFNNSGLPFDFNTFPSEFNYVNIVITPMPRPPFVAVRQAARRREAGEGDPPPTFLIQVMSKPGFPEISPAAEPKLVSLGSLAGFVRLMALNASVFSHVWSNRQGGEHISSWRARLREINRLRDRYAPKAQVALSPPATSMGASPPSTSTIQSSGAGLGTSMGVTSSASHFVDGGARPPSSVRDSFSSLRRSSVATFFTTTSTDPASYRSSVLSVPSMPTTEGSGETLHGGGADALVESVDFSKWS
ncbi:hypothetical protein VTK73DRAFT_5311 [Phialemonium thermophilum]|uniref:Rap-GAP domain-containing protein n=1 Tax=Phialemonium thermophilum TaxID=223376 RepID=A0ABR3Y878_9PEZI